MTVFFPDVSNYQRGLSLTGAVAVIAKATQGVTYTDPYYANFKSQAATLGIPFAGYHWVNALDLQLQANNAYAALRDTPTMWDAEAAGATVPRLVELTNRFRALGGNPTLVYLPHWWWQQLGSPDLTPLAHAGLSLISSSYTTYSDNGIGWQPYGGMTPAIWQYTDAQAFNGQHVDFNAFKGTQEELRALFNGGADMPLTQDDATLCARTLLATMLGRSGPTVGVALQSAIADAAGGEVVTRQEFTDLTANVDQILTMLKALTVGGDHTHTVTATAAGSTGPAVPLDPTP